MLFAQRFCGAARKDLVPATRDHRPELLDRWEVLRAAKEEDGQVIFTFLFYGGGAAA